MIVLIGLWAASYTFAFMFMCKGKFEILFTDLMATMIQCVDTFKVGYSCSISDFVGDALILLIPLPFVSSRSTLRFFLAGLTVIIDLEAPTTRS
jgi:hypothetical protein